MKTIPKLIAVISCSFILLTAPTGCSTMSGIVKFSTTPLSAQTTSEIIINAEHLANIGDDAMNTFNQMEAAHHDAIMKVSSLPFEFAEKMRADVNNNGIQDGLDAENTLRAAIKAFKKNRSGSRANLVTAYSTFQAIIDDCTKYKAVAVKAIK